jgi:hypothetical protein
MRNRLHFSHVFLNLQTISRKIVEIRWGGTEKGFFKALERMTSRSLAHPCATNLHTKEGLNPIKFSYIAQSIFQYVALNQIQSSPG